MKVTCGGEKVAGRFEARFEEDAVKFVFYPSREQQLIKPGQMPVLNYKFEADATPRLTFFCGSISLC
jgi:hypothetical protein